MESLYYLAVIKGLFFWRGESWLTQKTLIGVF